jgi:hypothetical protein
MSLTFSTSKSNFSLERSEKALTSFGGLLAFATFLKHLKIIEELVESCPVKLLSNNKIPLRDSIVGFILTSILDGRRFSDIRILSGDPLIAQAFGIEKRIPSDDTIRRLFARFDCIEGRTWIESASKFIYNSLNSHCVIDWDSTVTTRFGDQEKVEVGYNPTKPGRGSHHPLIAVIAGTRIALGMDFRAGNASSASGWIEMIERLLAQIPKEKWPYLNRADIGFSSEKYFVWHESKAEHPRYLTRLKKTSKVMEFFGKIAESDWKGAASIGALQVAEARIQLSGWTKERRVILTRRLITSQNSVESGDLFGTAQFERHAFVTNLDKNLFDAWQINDLYLKRCDCENVFDELKNHWGLAGFCSQDANVSELSARMNLLSYNLWSLFSRFFNSEGHTEAKKSRREYLLMPGRICKTAAKNTLKIFLLDDKWEALIKGYEKLKEWVNSTAPQLNSPSKEDEIRPTIMVQFPQNSDFFLTDCGI